MKYLYTYDLFEGQSHIKNSNRVLELLNKIILTHDFFTFIKKVIGIRLHSNMIVSRNNKDQDKLNGSPHIRMSSSGDGDYTSLSFFFKPLYKKNQYHWVGNRNVVDVMTVYERWMQFYTDCNSDKDYFDRINNLGGYEKIRYGGDFGIGDNTFQLQLKCNKNRKINFILKIRIESIGEVLNIEENYHIGFGTSLNEFFHKLEEVLHTISDRIKGSMADVLSKINSLQERNIQIFKETLHTSGTKFLEIIKKYPVVYNEMNKNNDLDILDDMSSGGFLD